MQNDYTAELLSDNNSSELNAAFNSPAADSVRHGGASFRGLSGDEAGVPQGSPFGSSLSTKPLARAKRNTEYIASFSIGGEHIVVKPDRSKVERKASVRPGGDREAITTFTGKSKLALKRTFNKLDKAATSKAQLVTLTYCVNMQDAPQAKRHLKVLGDRLRRAYPSAGFIWKMECQKRGAIHFHLLVFGIKYLPWEWVSWAWCEIVTQDAGLSIEQITNQLNAGTQVKAARNLWEAKSYLEKYLGKTDQTGELDEPGRWWGTHRLEAFKAPVVEVPQMTARQVVYLARTLDKMHRAAIMSAWTKKEHPTKADWMVNWARRRKKNVLEHSTVWRYDAAGSIEPLLRYVLTE
jgi:hypothetical protein